MGVDDLEDPVGVIFHRGCEDHDLEVFAHHVQESGGVRPNIQVASQWDALMVDEIDLPVEFMPLRGVARAMDQRLVKVQQQKLPMWKSPVVVDERRPLYNAVSLHDLHRFMVLNEVVVHF